MDGLIQLWPELRWTEVLDIVLVSLLAAALLVWLRSTQAGFVAIGLLVFAAVYVAARALDLTLLTGLFEGSLAVFLIIVVVIFQQELRQLFERVAAWVLRRPPPAPPVRGSLDSIVECLSNLSRARIGALLVIPGDDPLDRHVDGGILADAILSRPLLESLFDPSSPGHDGAVVLQDSRISHFGVHLPLSQDFEQLDDRGTRHSAALGLAERCDATCLVVSEETGHISVVRDGHLRTLERVAELKPLLSAIWTSRHASDVGQSLLEVLRAHWTDAALAGAVVGGLWFFFSAGSVMVDRSLDVPVEVVNLPDDLKLRSVEPSHVSLSFRGERRSFYRSAGSRVVVVLDGAITALGRRTFQIRASDVRHPPRLELLQVEPPSVRLSLASAGGGSGGPE